MNNTDLKASKYNVPKFGPLVNSAVELIFYYRLFFVFISIIGLVFLSVRVWNNSIPVDRYKNVATIFTCGSVIVGIFYLILNYEYNQRRFNHEVQTAKEHLSFQTGLEWQKKDMVDYSEIAGAFYEKHKDLLNQGNPLGFQQELDKDSVAYTSTLAVINFVESVALGVNKHIVDEEFTRAFFSSVFLTYYNRYGIWIEYQRRERQNVKVWNHFTELSDKWLNC